MNQLIKPSHCGLDQKLVDVYQKRLVEVQLKDI